MSDKMTPEFKSKAQGWLSLAYALIFFAGGFLIVWVAGDIIEEHFGEKSGGFALFVIIPLLFLIDTIMVIVGGWFYITKRYGREVAEYVLFSWWKFPSKK